MRTIKFRAWNGKEMYESVEHTTINNHCTPHFERMIDSPDWELMQFIGLKDKNGKEIYEGDIVKFGSRITIVEYFESDFTWLIKRDDEMYTLCFLKGYGNFEVIGNIYENPELLNNGK